MVNPVKIYQAAHQFGQHEANIYIPDPDGHTENGDAYARKMGHDALDGLNPFNKKSAYEAGKSTLNAATVVVPGAVELDALKGLRAASTIADGEVITARAAAGAAAGTPEEAAAQTALRQAEARAATARAVYQAKLPGAEARKTADRARAAIRKARERRLDGARSSGDPLAPHTSESLAKAKAEEAKMHERWEQQGRHTGQQHQVLAHASEAPAGKHTKAIGKPSVMQMVDGNGDFMGKLYGDDVTLPGVKTMPLRYVKRADADREALRKQFKSTAEFDPNTKAMKPRPVVENRSNFLKSLTEAPSKVRQLKEAGITDKQIELMKQGKLPSKAWQVHHKLPLDDGGTNAPDNLVLIKNDPYHLAITNKQNSLTRDLNPGAIWDINDWPIPDGFVYPPKIPAASNVPHP